MRVINVTLARLVKFQQRYEKRHGAIAKARLRAAGLSGVIGDEEK